MLTLSSSKNILKPPPVCKKGVIPPSAAALYPGTQLQSWVYADDLRPSPNPLLTETIVLPKVQTMPLVYGVQFTTSGITIILTIEFESGNRRFDIAWTYIEGVVLVDNAVTGMQDVTTAGAFDSRLQIQTGDFARVAFQARITR